ncbi:nitroreductase family protein [Ruegeria meonggei]|uniref:Malonic semialdehyde reductase n=1 Tax=Ruegeria meonggei TaxID=1446476 RepID=A0A1X6YZF4_9RHOB|nr:nitroreductase family protein [Ruegeria meonggei]SLN35631.1 malonic semialdehyde reductase [Ruegeria meonggei]
MHTARTADHPIEPLILSRWSPRAYDASQMPQSDLLTILEGGRWAPSAFNIQPWRFLYARREDKHWSAFTSILNPENQEWARQASALIFLISDTVMPADGNRLDATSNYNSFDAGAAWMQVALQATALGYGAHAMAGLNFDQASKVLNLPDRFRLEVGITIGRAGDTSGLSDDLRAREVPSGRMPLKQISYSGPFPVRFHDIAAE